MTISVAARIRRLSVEEIRRRVKSKRYRSEREGSHVYVHLDDVLAEDSPHSFAALAFKAFRAGESPVELVERTGVHPNTVSPLWEAFKRYQRDPEVQKRLRKNGDADVCPKCRRTPRQRSSEEAYLEAEGATTRCEGCGALVKSDVVSGEA